jgi:hypothetical protein
MPSAFTSLPEWSSQPNRIAAANDKTHTTHIYIGDAQMKRFAMIFAVLVGLAVSASPALAYYPSHHHYRPPYPAYAGYRGGYGNYGANYYPSYGTSINLGIGVPNAGFGYSTYPAYGYGYPAYGVRYGYPSASFASPQSFGFGPAAVFGY